MSFVWPVDAYEMADSPHESFPAIGSFHATVQLRCAWQDRFTLMRYATTDGGMLYPRAPGTLARCRSASAVPAPGKLSAEDESGSALACYDKALVTLQFVRDKRTPETTQLVSETIQPTSEHVTRDPSLFRWGSANGDRLEPMEAPSVLVRGLDYLITFHEVYIVPAAILTLPGYVNSSAVTTRLLGLTFPAETLLFQPPTITRRITSKEIGAWTCAFRFSYRASTWNKPWHAKDQKFDTLYTIGGNRYRSYPLADFASAFPSVVSS